MASDIVTVRTYRKDEKMERSKAIAFFKDAVENCEGSERDRYVEVLMDLLEGKTFCSDKEE